MIFTNSFFQKVTYYINSKVPSFILAVILLKPRRVGFILRVQFRLFEIFSEALPFGTFFL